MLPTVVYSPACTISCAGTIPSMRTASRPERSHLGERALAKVQTAVLASYPPLLVLLAWELIARAGLIRPLFLPSLTEIAQQFWALLLDGEIIDPLLVSLYR